jgi:hypothetical protein
VLNMVKEDIRHYSSQYGAHFSTQPNYYWTSWCNQTTTGNCEDTCQMICLPDF